MDQIKKKDGFRHERHIIFPSHLNHQFQDHPLIKETYLTEIGYYPNAKYHYRERMQGVEEYILIYCLEGQGIIEIPNKTISLNRGDIFCIPKKISHRYYANQKDPWSILWMHFNTELNIEFGLDKEQMIAAHAIERYSLLQSHFIDLFELGEKAKSLETSICTSQLLRLVLSEIYYLTDTLASQQKNSYLSRCITYMNDNINQPLTLNNLAAHLEISASYLSAIFKSYTDRSPIDYFIDMRIEQACKYLKLSELRIYEVAKKVGYNDPYYFSRQFKKTTGYSPREYRTRFSKNVSNDLKPTKS